MNSTNTQAVYLDTNHWYALGAAKAGRPDRPEHVDILRELEERAKRGSLRFPLSSVHYMELTENPRDKFRTEAADVMSVLSGFLTIAPSERIVDEEMAKELNRRFGRPAFPVKVPKFGLGVGFALGETRHLKAKFSGDQRPLIEASLGMSIEDYEDRVNVEMEYSVLATPSAIRTQMPGFDPYAARRQADKDLASMNVMVETLRTDPDIGGRPMDAVCARQLFFEIEENFVRAKWNGGFKNGFPRGSSDAGEVLTDFLMHLPTRRVWTMMMFHYLKDINRPLAINDLRDVEGVAVAIPYCDVVVTDAKVRDAATHRTHLDSEFGTAVFSKLTDLADHLGL